MVSGLSDMCWVGWVLNAPVLRYTINNARISPLKRIREKYMGSESMWDKLANNWDTPGVSLGENDLKIIKQAKKNLNTNSIVLDYGCATGSIAIEIAGMVKEVHGIDISSNMIGIAVKKAGDCKIANVNFMKATIFDERLHQESYDLILSLSILHLVNDLPQVINRINQLLKPGGVFISATPCLGENTFSSRLTGIPLLLLSKIRILPHINFFNVSRLETLISSENFEIIETENVSVNHVTDCFIIARKI
jgi:2-polyprenyl-3-methyl-5-hydroxy-6-metoxy-1,4-benzoquinol methylase